MRQGEQAWPREQHGTGGVKGSGGGPAGNTSFSGLSIREFCRRGKLKESAFYFWRRELKGRQAEQEQRGQSAAPLHGNADCATATQPLRDLCTLPTDMRKGFDTLAALVKDFLGYDPLA